MTTPIKQPTFAGGEISPALYARADNAIYEKSLRTLRNMLTMRQGGVTGRPGTMYVGTALNGGDQIRLIPFVFNETGLGQSYMLEFGDQYIAFYQDGANVISSTRTITAITQATPGVVTAVGHGFSNGDIVLITDVLGMTEVDNRYFIVANVAVDTFELTDLLGVQVDTSTFTTYTSGGSANKIYLISTPYLQADLETLMFAQSADVLTIVHSTYPPAELSRAAATSWTLTQNIQNLFHASLAGPGSVSITGTAGGTTLGYYVTSVNSQGEETDDSMVVLHGSASSLTPASLTNPVDITWAAVTGAISYRIYGSIWLGGGSVGQYGLLGEVTGLAFVDFGDSPDFSRLYPVNPLLFRSGQYPAVVGFIQQRRVFANTPANPIGFWMSQPGLYYNFNASVPIIDSDSVFGSLAGEEVNAISNIAELRFALLLTTGAEIYVQGNGNGVITPSAINAAVQSHYGCAPLRVLKVSDILLFNQSLGSAIRDFAFDFAIDGYRGNDITVFATHLFEGYQIEDWAYQKVPDSIVWAVRSDGVLLSCTYVREQQVLAWAHHDLTDGLVENVCAIPENGEYAVYLSVKRTVGEETVRYIERISSRIWSDPLTATYLDCFASFDGRNVAANGMTITQPTTVFIAQGINDTIQFTDGGVQYTAVIPPGSYLPADLATAVTTAMNAQSNRTYLASMSTTYFQIDNDGTAFTLEFSEGSANFNKSAAVTLGFLEQDYVVTSGNVSAFPGPILFYSECDAAYQQTLLLFSEFAFFTPAMVGDQIKISVLDADTSEGYELALTIQSYDATNLVHVTPSGIVPEDLRGIGSRNWAHAVKTLSGLTHLAGQEVSVWADRFVVGSPLNYHVQTVYTVSAGGSLTLDKPYAVIYVGLPMIQDVQTLDRETAAGQSLIASRKIAAALNVYLMNTRTLFAGSENPDTNLNNTDDVVLFELYELMRGTSQLTYDQPPQLVTGQDYVIDATRWNKNGRMFIRNVDPTPLTILAIGVGGSSKSQNPAYERV